MVGLIPNSKRAPLYRDVPLEKWNDWRWQLSHRLNSAAELGQVIRLTESERSALSIAGNLFRVDITPYFLSLIDPDNPEVKEKVAVSRRILRREGPPPRISTRNPGTEDRREDRVRDILEGPGSQSQ